MEPTPTKITALEPNQILVFGSNTQGRHGSGLAKVAVQFGAENGNPIGRQGQTYAIVTKDLTKPPAQQARSVPLTRIGQQIHQLCRYAKAHPDLEFLVTRIGCGLAGYTDAEIGDLWKDKVIPKNVRLPQEFLYHFNPPFKAEATPPFNPLKGLKLLNERVAGPMQKDMAMAEVATQFIGHSAAPLSTPSSTRNYEQAWGDRANTGQYTPDDVVMVSGSGPWRGVTDTQIQRTFDQHYKPLLDTAITARAQIVVGDAKGTDQLVQSYLRQRGISSALKMDSYGGHYRSLPKPQQQATQPLAQSP